MKWFVVLFVSVSVSVSSFIIVEQFTLLTFAFGSEGINCHSQLNSFHFIFYFFSIWIHFYFFILSFRPDTIQWVTALDSRRRRRHHHRRHLVVALELFILPLILTRPRGLIPNRGTTHARRRRRNQDGLSLRR